MRYLYAAAAVLALFSAALLAAAPPPRIMAEWNSRAGLGSQFTKILAIGITDDREVRHRFEDRLVSHLRARNFAAVTSYSLVPDLTAPGSREEILRKLEEEKIDAVISFRVVPLEKGGEEAWDAEWRRQTESGGTLRALIERTLPVKETKPKLAGVEVTLWGIGEPGRLWAGRSGLHKLEELRKGAGDFIQEVIYTLRDHKWL